MTKHRYLATYTQQVGGSVLGHLYGKQSKKVISNKLDKYLKQKKKDGLL